MKVKTKWQREFADEINQYSLEELDNNIKHLETEGDTWEKMLTPFAQWKLDYMKQVKHGKTRDRK